MKRFRKILAVTPDAAPSEGVLAWLGRVAAQAGTEGIDLLVRTRPDLAEYPVIGEGGEGETPESPAAEIARAAAAALPGKRVELIEADSAPLRATLKRLATGDYDLVVVPVSDPADRGLAERLARKSPVGVLVLPELAPVPPARVLAALDFSSLSPLVIEWAEAFATLRPEGSRLEAVHVLDLSVRTRATMIREAKKLRDDLREEARWQLDSFLEEHAREPGKWERRLIEGHVPAGELVERIKDPDVLLVIGCQGRNALSVAMLGSDAAEIVRHSERPVLVVKPKNQNLGFLRQLIGAES